MTTLSRRGFLAALPTTLLAALALRPRRARADRPGAARASGHPEPRPGIDGSRVLTAEQLADAPHVIEIFDGVREIPHIADGLRCYCGCADLPGYRSLLSCFEETGMARYCDICQGQAVLAHRRWREGQSLDQIRRATDARYGDGRPRSLGHHGPRPGAAVGPLAAVVALTAVTALAAVAAPAPAAAQIRASEPATVSQTVDGTTLTIEYSRPRARGRSDLFGGEVKWGEVWTPGANDATVFDLSRDVTIDGRAVPAGRWSVWMVVAEAGDWELVLDPRDTLFHTAHPEPTEEQIRFPVRALPDEHVEVLTWSFPAVTSQGMTVRLAWAGTRVELEVGVTPSYTRAVAADEAAAYVGGWVLSFAAMPGGDGPPPPMDFDVRHEEGGDLLSSSYFFGPAEGLIDMLLLPAARGIFVPAFMEDGEIFDALGGLFLEFEFEDDRAVAFVLREEKTDRVWARAERRP